MKKDNSKFIVLGLNRLFPNAKCELKHKNDFELLIAVILSAQSTDERVNKVCSKLFKKYSNAKKLADAKLKDVEEIIMPLGLYHNKAKNIIDVSKELVKKYEGKVPDTRRALEKLPGVGRKTCNIILNNCFGEDTFAVDTHVTRVATRLKLVNKTDDVLVIEKKLMKFFPKELWGKLHHQFIAFGRNKCKAINPDCVDCPFVTICGRVS